MKKKLFSIVLCIVILISNSNLVALADEKLMDLGNREMLEIQSYSDDTFLDSGECGFDLDWTLDKFGKLTISGQGAMDDYVSNNRPWEAYIENIKSVELEEGITRIGNYAFCDCVSLGGELVLPKSIESIGGKAFYGCKMLTGDLVIPENVKSIGESAFCSCSGFRGILTLPEGLYDFDTKAFEGCNGLEYTNELDAFTSDKTVGYYKLTNVHLKAIGGIARMSAEVTNLGADVENDQKIFLRLYNHNGECVLTLNGIMGAVASGETTYIDMGVTAICYAFAYDYFIEFEVDNRSDMTLENNNPIVLDSGEVTGRCGAELEWTLSTDGKLIISGQGVMDDYASNSRPWEEYVDRIKELQLGEGITRIGDYAFFECSNLGGELKIPESLETIGEKAFYSCKMLTGDLNIPNNVKIIEDSAFTECSGFSGMLTLPQDLKEFDTKAFEGCNGLEYINTLEAFVTDKTVGYYKLTNVRMKASGGITRMTAEVTNQGDDVERTQKIVLKLFNHEGQCVETLNGLMGAVDSGETTYIDLGVTAICYAFAYDYSIEFEVVNTPHSGQTNEDPQNEYTYFSELYSENECIPGDAVLYNGHFYFLFKEPLSYMAAKAYCENLNGYLACITTSEENEFLFNYISDQGVTNAWFGLMRVNGNWTWVNGEKFEYANWHTGEPGNVEPYGQYYSKFGDNTWNDAQYGSGYFICEWDNGIPSINVETDETIISAVERYTNGKEIQEVLAILNGHYTDEQKVQMLFEYYHYDNMLDVADRIHTLSATHDERWDYNGLMQDEMYLSWQYYNYLNNTPMGIAARTSLYLNGLAFNNEIDNWINPSTYLDGNYPGVEKYQSMLEDFIKNKSIEIEYYSYIKTVQRFVNDSVNIWSDVEKGEILKELGKTKNIVGVQSVFNKFVKSKINGLDGNTIIFDYEEETKFMRAMGIAGKVFKCTNATVDGIIDFIEVESNIETYNTWHDFLMEISEAEDIPWELRVAAYRLDLDLGEAYWTPIKNILNVIRDECFDKALELTKFGEVVQGNEYLLAIKFTSFCINQFVDIGTLVKNSCQTEGYVLLAKHYENKLKRCEDAFIKDKTEENAWAFYEAYTMLWELRIAGEEKFLEMNRLEGGKAVDGLQEFITGGTLAGLISDICGYHDKEAAVKENIELIKTFEFKFSPKSVPEQYRYLQKATFECPVNVETLNSESESVFLLNDNQEMDQETEYGRFVSFYRATTGDYVKIVYWNTEESYQFNVTGAEKGEVTYTYVKATDETAYSVSGFDSEKVEQGTTISLDTNKEQYTVINNGHSEDKIVVNKIKPSTIDVTSIFDDVKFTDWYYSAVQYAYDNGIMKGTGEDFEPNKVLPREQFVQVLYNITGQPSVTGLTNSFTDVKNEWYYDAVLWATKNEVTNGIGGGKFGVGNNITREQLVTMTYRYAEKYGYDLTKTSGTITPYFDSAKVSDWAQEAFDWAVSQGIVTGKGIGTDPADLSLDPQGTATRAECAAIMMRLLQKNGK